MKRPPIYRKLIASADWQRLRRDKLTANPLCEDCQAMGIDRSASEVHHVRPVETGRNAEEQTRLMFDYGNLRSLCRECHRAAHRVLGKGTRAERDKRRTEAEEQAARALFGGSSEGEGGGVFSNGGGPAKPRPPSQENSKEKNPTACFGQRFTNKRVKKYGHKR